MVPTNQNPATQALLDFPQRRRKSQRNPYCDVNFVESVR